MMFQNFYSYHTWPGGMNFLWMPWIMPLVLLELVLKGMALWKAAKNNQQYWFIALFVINTAGILPAVYMAFFQKKQK